MCVFSAARTTVEAELAAYAIGYTTRVPVVVSGKKKNTVRLPHGQLKTARCGAADFWAAASGSILTRNGGP